MELSFVHLHSVLFFANRSWGDKIMPTDPKHKGKIRAFRFKEGLDDGIKLMSVGKESIIPISNIISYEYMTESKAAQQPAMQEPQKAKPGPKPKGAQAQTPHDHVFAGQGAGKTTSV